MREMGFNKKVLKWQKNTRETIANLKFKDFMNKKRTFSPFNKTKNSIIQIRPYLSKHSFINPLQKVQEK